YACDHCEHSFVTQRGLEWHLRLHLNMKPHICEVCGKLFPVPSRLRNHVNPLGRNPTPAIIARRPYTCEYCRRGFATSSNLTKHI
ncbi:hypothetical protein BJ085DRAFT_4559, partial [Dimargaris cristalligena]